MTRGAGVENSTSSVGTPIDPIKGSISPAWQERSSAMTRFVGRFVRKNRAQAFESKANYRSCFERARKASAPSRARILRTRPDYHRRIGRTDRGRGENSILIYDNIVERPIHREKFAVITGMGSTPNPPMVAKLQPFAAVRDRRGGRRCLPRVSIQSPGRAVPYLLRPVRV
jgi:hypothetical protein